MEDGRMIGELNIYGLFVSPLLLWVLMALPATGLLRRVLRRIGVYRAVWHPPLFDLALFVIVLGAVATLTAAATGIGAPPFHTLLHGGLR
jgi:hypothetical protein